MKDIITRVTELIVIQDGDAIFNESATIIKIEDLAGGEFVRVRQPCETEPGISIDPTHWPAIRDAIDKLIQDCRS